MDITSILGPLIGIGLVLLGQAMEGGSITQLIQVTAALIVLGGSLGAVVNSFPLPVLINAVSMLKDVYGNIDVNYETTIQELLQYAQKARKEGIISLEKDAKTASDPLMTMGLESVSDGSDPVLVKSMMENQLSRLEEKVTAAAKVWESFGGYTPTLGIVGAVLGLIQVMQNLNDPSKLGAGIAVAFVATIYGLIAANIFFIPFASKLKFKYQGLILKKEIIIEGILAIQAGESPALIERKLQSFLLENKKSEK